MTSSRVLSAPEENGRRSVTLNIFFLPRPKVSGPSQVFFSEANLETLVGLLPVSNGSPSSISLVALSQQASRGPRFWHLFGCKVLFGFFRCPQAPWLPSTPAVLFPKMWLS